MAFSLRKNKPPLENTSKTKQVSKNRPKKKKKKEANNNNTHAQKQTNKTDRRKQQCRGMDDVRLRQTEDFF